MGKSIRVKHILYYLIHDRVFRTKVLPHLDTIFFDGAEQTIYEAIRTYSEKYKNSPSIDALRIIISDSNDGSLDMLNDLVYSPDAAGHSTEFLVDSTEQWAKDRAIWNALRKSIAIYEEGTSRNEIAPIIQDALALSFSGVSSQSLFDDVENRYASYVKAENKVPFDLTYLNEITNGGVDVGTLNIIMAGTNVGKSLALCHFAAANVRDGLNAVYVTLEMSAERISQRVEANLLEMEVDAIEKLDIDSYIRGMEKIRNRYTGNLETKQFETGRANCMDISSLLTELKEKKNFKADVLYVDYVNLASSIRYKGNAHTSYVMVKAIAEELRGLAVEHGVAVWTATQLNRSGYNSSNLSLADVSESFGVVMTADVVISLQEDDDLAEQGMYLCKILKNRYGDRNKNPSEYIKVDKAKMTLSDMPKNNFIHQTPNQNQGVGKNTFSNWNSVVETI